MRCRAERRTPGFRALGALTLALALGASAGCGAAGDPGGGGAQVAASGSAVPSTEEIVLRTSDGLDLDATHHHAGDPREVVTVLVAHGNGGGRSLRAPLADALVARGLSVLLLEYRGFGGNPGRPTEPGLALDARAAHRYLTEDVGVPPGRLLYFGESLGTSVVSELAREHPPAGVVLRSPFLDYASIGATAYYPAGEVPIAPGDVFATAEHVAALDVPVTVVYGDADILVPPRDSRAVAEGARNLAGLVAVPGADHNDQELLDGDLLIDAVADLAAQVAP